MDPVFCKPILKSAMEESCPATASTNCVFPCSEVGEVGEERLVTDKAVAFVMCEERRWDWEMRQLSPAVVGRRRI